MGWLDGTTALVTGAGSGIGAAVTRRFVEEGARVVACDVVAERLAALQSDLGDAVVTAHADVRKPVDNHRVVALALERFGKLDTFVGNAGIWDGKRRLSDLSDEELEAGFDEVFALDVKGYFLGAKAARAAVAAARGSMVFTLSTSSYYVGGGGPIYIAAKHATLGLVRGLAYEFAPEIRVNGVAPSGTPTAMANPQSIGGQSSGTPRATPNNLLRLQVAADDHAGAYVLLASKYGRNMTGTVIDSDGGRGVMAAYVG